MIGFQKPIIVAYSEINLILNETAQKKILEDLGIPALADSNIEFFESQFIGNSQIITENEVAYRVSRNEPSLTNRLPTRTSLYDLQHTALSKWVGLTPLENHPREPHAYGMSPMTSPLSTAKDTLKPKEKLIAPLYLSEEFIRHRYNSQKYVDHNNTINKIFKVNSKAELILIDKKILDSQRGIIGDVIKQAGFLFLTGQGLVRMSLPIRIFDTKSMIQKIGEFFANLGQLHKACELEPGIELFKHVISYYCGNYLYGIDSRKPFNPLLGETLQGFYLDGTKLYIEHLNHDPPIDQLLFVNSNKNFRIAAKFETVPKVSSNELKLNFKGVVETDIKGNKIYCTLPFLINKGLVFGTNKIVLDDYFYFHYPSQGLKAYIKVGQGPRVDSLNGAIYQSTDSPDLQPERFASNIFPSFKPKKLSQEKLLSTISGFWLEKLEFDGMPYWTHEQKGFKIHMEDDVLPSDWRFREDLLWLMYGNSVYAQAWKLKLEDLFREWKKMREIYAKNLNKKK